MNTCWSTKYVTVFQHLNESVKVCSVSIWWHLQQKSMATLNTKQSTVAANPVQMVDARKSILHYWVLSHPALHSDLMKTLNMTHHLAWNRNNRSWKLTLKSELPASHPSVTCLFQWCAIESPASHRKKTWASVRLSWPGARWPAIIVWKVSYIQYLLAWQKLQRSVLYNMVKSDLTWSRVFCHCHLGRRVSAVTRLWWSIKVMREFIARLGPNCSTSGILSWWMEIRLIILPPMLF